MEKNRRILKSFTKYIILLLLAPAIHLAANHSLLDIPADDALIIRFSPAMKATDFIQKWKQPKSEMSQHFILDYERPLSSRLNIHRFRFQSNEENVSKLLDHLRDQQGIDYVQLDRTVNFRNTPNDQWIGRQWSIEKIGLERVWDISTGGLTTQGDTIVIAILDQGFDIDHEDLIQNIWKNKAEISFDGIDNDQNGYIDDQTGWNFVGDGPDFTPNSHGSSVAGIIGAKGNNQIGVAGINWNIKLMLFQIAQVSDVISAYEYIVQQRQWYNETDGREGAFVVATNASFGADDVFCSQEPLWGAMYDELGEVGILTGSGASNRGTNIDQSGDIPSTCTSPYLVTVLNTNEGDVKENNSSYSTTYIDMGSPGENSYTTKPFDRYGVFGDNSAAAPHLTGAIGLLYAIACPDLIAISKSQPGQAALFIKDLLLQGVDIIPGLDQYTLTGGRLNVWKTVELLQQSCQQEKEANLAWDKVFPNPASEVLYLDYILSVDTDHEITVYNTLGQLVWKKGINGQPISINHREVIDVAAWSKGAYIIRISSKDKDIEAMFIKN